jgi:hypothetical protein
METRICRFQVTSFLDSAPNRTDKDEKGNEMLSFDV